MMRTPSLRLRVVIAGFAVGAGLVIALSTFVYLSLGAGFDATLQDVLAARVQLVRELGVTLEGAALDRRLVELGVPAVVVTADGDVVTDQPVGERFTGGPPAPPGGPPEPLLASEVPLPDGGSVTVFVSRAGVERTLRRVLLLEGVGTAAVLAFLLVLLVRASTVVLGPLHHVVLTARRIAQGRTGERLQPDRPDTELGQMAAAFDDMLDTLEQALEDTREAVEVAKASEARTRRFLADAAHQMRTPVAALRASVQGLMITEDDEQRERLLDHVAAETARTARLVGSLLRMAAIDAAEAGDRPAARTAPPAVIDLHEVAAAEVERARGMAPDLDITLEVQGPARASAEAEGVREALANLLDNARRHARSRIGVTLHREGDLVAVRVVDDGRGLAPGTEEEVFERFRTFSGRGGAGLGLPIARGIARGYGGDVVFRDGAFVLSLPAGGDPDPVRPEGHLPATGDGSATFQGDLSGRSG